MIEKRLAIMNVPVEYLFFHFFAIPMDGKVELRIPTLLHPGSGKKVNWQECKIISVNVNHERDCVQFKLASDEFDIVAEGEVIPCLDFSIEERHVKVVDDEYPVIGLNDEFIDMPVVIERGPSS